MVKTTNASKSKRIIKILTNYDHFACIVIVSFVDLGKTDDLLYHACKIGYNTFLEHKNLKSDENSISQNDLKLKSGVWQKNLSVRSANGIAIH